MLADLLLDAVDEVEFEQRNCPDVARVYETRFTSCLDFPPSLALFDDAELFLFLGADSYFELEQWRRWQDLLSLVTLAVLRRPGHPGPDSSSRRSGERVAWLENEPVDLSSSGLRERLRRGDPIDPAAVSPLVVDYCRKYKLYR